ncbi:MAG: cytochrome b/b6 domain-containing protein [Steroidobacteraceae bacterium]
MSAPLKSLQPVWDLPARISHWLLVILITYSWRSAENGYLEYHRYSGYALLGIVTFRVYWGFAGSSTARFANFIHGPARTWQYVRELWRKRQPEVVGHNPLGAWSILALLTLLAVQIGLGLFSVDVDGLESGPLSEHVSFDTGRACAHWHERVFNVLLAFIGLHIAAVAYYWLAYRKNLVASMLHGKAALPTSAAPVEFASGVRFVIGVVLAALLVWLVV